jgi:phosphotransferase system IIB component
MSAASAKKSRVRVALADRALVSEARAKVVVEFQQMVEQQQQEIRVVCARSDNLATERDIQRENADASAYD